MGKKNIQPNSSQPVFRSLVARPALEELREENLTEGNQGQRPNGGEVFPNASIDLKCGINLGCVCSYDGDDE